MKSFDKKRFFYRLLFYSGILLFIVPIILKPHLADDWHKITSASLGLGILLIGFSGYRVTQYDIKKKNPELARIQNIEMKDERNTLIRNKALAKANIVLIGVIFATIMVLSFFSAEWYIPVTLAGFIVINGVIFTLYCRYYAKRL